MNELSAPFRRGTTFYNGATIDTAAYAGIALEGRLCYFENTSPTAVNSGRKTRRDASQVITRIVRNVSGRTLLPAHLVQWQSTNVGKRIIGFTSTVFQKPAGVVDDHIGTSVPNGDLFHLVVKGMCNVRTDAAAGATNVIAAQDFLVCQTAAASTHSTTAGRCIPYAQTSNATFGDLQAVGIFGQAVNAATTSETQVLADIQLL